jgi:hypothetical protein
MLLKLLPNCQCSPLPKLPIVSMSPLNYQKNVSLLKDKNTLHKIQKLKLFLKKKLKTKNFNNNNK